MQNFRNITLAAILMSAASPSFAAIDMPMTMFGAASDVVMETEMKPYEVEQIEARHRGGRRGGREDG